eukprot:UN16075
MVKIRWERKTLSQFLTTNTYVSQIVDSYGLDTET